METSISTNQPHTIPTIAFGETDDPYIYSVDGKSTDSALVNLIGISNKPKDLKYIQFLDGTYAVVRARGSEGYTVRSPRSSSSNPPATNVRAALDALDAEMASKRAKIRENLVGEIARKREELAQLEHSLTQLTTH